MTAPARNYPNTHTVTLPPELAELVSQKAKVERSSPAAIIRFCIDETLRAQTTEAPDAADSENASQNQQ